MAFWRTLGRVTGIYAVMHVTRLVGDGVNYILGGDESQKKNKNLERKLRLEQMKYIQASNFKVEQQQALKKIIGGQEIEYALQEEQDELQRKLQTAIYELDNRNKVKKYADNRMTNNIKNRTEYFPKKARRIHQTYYWDTQDIEGKSLRIEQLDFSQKQTYSGCSTGYSLSRPYRNPFGKSRKFLQWHPPARCRKNPEWKFLRGLSARSISLPWEHKSSKALFLQTGPGN